MESLELQNYKMKLEVLELEQKLNITRSKYTRDIDLAPSTSSEVQNTDENSFLIIPNDNLILNEDGTILTMT